MTTKSITRLCCAAVFAFAVTFAANLSFARNEKWEPTIQKFEAADAQTSPPKNGILFVGSSSIVGWNVKKFFPDLPVINRGFGGSVTSDVIDYFDRIIPPYEPKIIVFYSGDNDLSGGKTTTTVGNDVKKLASMIREALPETRLIIIPPKPSISRWKLWESFKQVGALEKEFADATDKVEFMDPTAAMLGTDGQPRPELFKGDKLHMTDEGYIIWSDMLRPMLKDAATTDSTTGDLGTSKTAAILSPVAPGVWMHRSWFRFPNGDTYFSNGLVVKSELDNTAVLVDTPWGEQSTTNLLSNIQGQLGLKVKAAIVTHWHADKTAGVDILKKQGIPVYARPETIELCKKNNKPVPDHALTGIDQPGQITKLEGLEIIYPGPGHASDNILVWEPRTSVLLGGCAVRGASDTTPGNLSDANLEQWPASMQRVEEAYGKRAKLVIPGHGEPAGPELLHHTATLAERFSKLTSDKALGN